MSALPEIPFRHGDATELGYVQTIPRHLVHKRRIENVFITSMRQMGDLEFHCGAYVPQTNLYLNDMKSHANDVVLTLVEIGRQAAMACGHRYLDIPKENHFILSTLGAELLPRVHEVDWLANDSVEIRFQLREPRFTESGQLKSTVAEGEFIAGNEVVWRQHALWGIQPGTRYRELRAHSRENALSERPANRDIPPIDNGFEINARPRLKRSVLGDNRWLRQDGIYAAELVTDFDNLFFFDHPNDHLPGMLLLEGMRQLAEEMVAGLPAPSASRPRIQRLELGFKSFAELDQPTAVIARMGEGAERGQLLHLQATQAGRVCAETNFLIG